MISRARPAAQSIGAVSQLAAARVIGHGGGPCDPAVTRGTASWAVTVVDWAAARSVGPPGRPAALPHGRGTGRAGARRGDHRLGSAT